MKTPSHKYDYLFLTCEIDANNEHMNVIWVLVSHKVRNTKGKTDYPVQRLTDCIQQRGIEHAFTRARVWAAPRRETPGPGAPKKRNRKTAHCTSESDGPGHRARVRKPVRDGNQGWYPTGKRSLSHLPPKPIRKGVGPSHALWQGGRVKPTVKGIAPPCRATAFQLV